MRARVGNVGATAENGDGRAALERTAVGTGIDAEGEATDDDQARRRELPTQLASNPTTVGTGPHGTVRIQLLQQGRVAAANQGPRCIGGIAQATRIARIVATAGPALRRDQVLAKTPLRHGFDLGQHLRRHLGRRGIGQVLVGEAQEFG